jgi:hypothetical protein
MAHGLTTEVRLATGKAESLRVPRSQFAWVSLWRAIPATLARRAENFNRNGFGTAAATGGAYLPKHFAGSKASWAVDVGGRRYQSGAVAR